MKKTFDEWWETFTKSYNSYLVDELYEKTVAIAAWKAAREIDTGTMCKSCGEKKHDNHKCSIFHTGD